MDCLPADDEPPNIRASVQALLVGVLGHLGHRNAPGLRDLQETIMLRMDSTQSGEMSARPFSQPSQAGKRSEEPPGRFGTSGSDIPVWPEAVRESSNFRAHRLRPESGILWEGWIPEVASCRAALDGDRCVGYPESLQDFPPFEAISAAPMAPVTWA